MKFLKNRAIIILIGIITILGSITVIISVKISITMIEKQDQLVQSASSAAAGSEKTAGKPMDKVNIDKAAQYPIYFNGEKLEELTYYIDGKENALLPFDIILNYLKAGFSLFNSDDVFKVNIDGKALLLRLGNLNASFSGKSIRLSTAPMAAKNHIMVPPEILDTVDGLKMSGDIKNGSVFINYWPPAKNKEYRNIKLFRLSGGLVDISDVFGTKSFKYAKTGPGIINDAAYYPDLSAYMVKSGEKTYLITAKNYMKPRILNVGSEYSVSVGGRFLYWMDKPKKALYIYNVSNGVKKKLKDYFSEIKSGNGIAASDFALLDFRYGSRYTAIDFQEIDRGYTYTVIERNKKVVVNGSSLYSPDHSRLIFHDNAKGWCIADADGTDIVKIGAADDVKWVDNYRALVNKGNALSLYDRGKKTMTPVDAEWRYAGQTSKGEVFITRGNTLFCSTGKTGKKLFDLPWKCDLVYAANNTGPYVLLSNEENGIFIFSDNKSILAGRPGLFPGKSPEGGIDTRFESNAAISPDNGKIAMLQRGQAFAEINITDFKDLTLKNLVLNIPVAEIDSGISFKVMWLDNEKIIVYTPKSGWLIDMADGIYVHEWAENEGDSIIGVLKQVK